MKIGYDDYRVVGVVEDASPLLTEIFANLFLPFAPRSNNYSTYEGVSTVRMLLAQGADVDKIKGEVARRMKSITAANGDKEEMKLRYGGSL